MQFKTLKTTLQLRARQRARSTLDNRFVQWISQQFHLTLLSSIYIILVMSYAIPRTRTSHPPVTVAVSPRFEMFHALRLVLEPVEGIHDQWCREARSNLSRSFFDRVKRFCSNPVIWPNLADAIERSALDGSFFEVLKAQAELDLDRLQYVLLESAFHDGDTARNLMTGKLTLANSLKNVSGGQKDWLSFFGLYPYDSGSPMVLFFERVLNNPEQIRDELLRLLNEFWDRVFDDTWADLAPALERAAATLERSIPTSSLSEIATRALLRIQVDDKARTITSVLGDYSVSFDDLERVHFTPSAFNYNRLWAVYENGETGLSTVVFPFFDPEIALSENEPRSRYAAAVIVEPLLIFKALGDSTRFAMIKILAEEPTTSVDLAKRLNVTKATVSHHVQKLRMAGLITEEWNNGSVTLTVRREVIEALSHRTIDLLFDNTKLPSTEF